VAQHDVKRLRNGNLSVFDNGREQDTIHPCAAKEYLLNEKKKTVSLVWKYLPDRRAHSVKGLGNVQRLADGRSLVNYGNNSQLQQLFCVLTPGLKKSFEISFADTLRAYRVYHYHKLPFQLRRPSVKTITVDGKKFLEAQDGFESYRWSSGERGRRIPATRGSYQVWVRIGENGFVSSVPVKIQ
jgi:hypothetical protein